MFGLGVLELIVIVAMLGGAAVVVWTVTRGAGRTAEQDRMDAAEADERRRRRDDRD